MLVKDWRMAGGTLLLWHMAFTLILLVKVQVSGHQNQFAIRKAFNFSIEGEASRSDFHEIVFPSLEDVLNTTRDTPTNSWINANNWTDSSVTKRNSINFNSVAEIRADILKNLYIYLSKGFARAEEILRQEREAAKLFSQTQKNNVSVLTTDSQITVADAKQISACRGLAIIETSKIIVESYQLPNEEIYDILHSIPLPENLTDVKSEFCGKRERSTLRQNINCHVDYPYRTINGFCNNLTPGLEQRGAARSPFKRYIRPQYGDGVSAIRGQNQRLPNARLLSFVLSRLLPTTPDDFMTQMLKGWGQFINHDLQFTTPGSGPDLNSDGVPDRLPCCDDGRDKRRHFEDCIPIDVEQDPFYRQFGTTCIRFVRSLAINSGGFFGVREQMNEITSYLDGSQIYGSTEAKKSELRLGRFGKMKTSRDGEDGSCASPNICRLPFLPETPGGGETNFFSAGDARANQQPGLTALHTLFLRYHNLCADEYRLKRQTATDEEIYQECRRIVGAVIQHITYDEFVPLMVGKTAATSFKLYSLRSGHSTAYDPSINPTIANSFSTAVFRFGHSLVGNQVKGISTINLATTFNRNSFMKNRDFFPSVVLQGECVIPSEKLDAKIVDSLTDKLFARNPFQQGSDLYSLNIMRGRDHGIPSYNAWRKFCKKKPFVSFDEMKTEVHNAVVDKFASFYQSVEDVDFFPAGIAEFRVKDGFIGDTFACIMARQMHELKFGDRFWYENLNQPKPFTEDQLSAIRRTNLSSVMCAASTIGKLQPYPMLSSQLTRNELKDCSVLRANDVLSSIRSLW